MATWAIGDIQGCFSTLQRLLERIGFDPRRDRLWLVGDLVNRGPSSVEVLRWARALGDRVVAVLGNHDLKLLAVASGTWRGGAGDTIDGVLDAPDREALLEWVRHRPLAHAEGGWLMIHAGLSPAWTAAEAVALAAEAQAVIRSADAPALFASLKEHPPRAWDGALTGLPRLAAITHALTRLRTATLAGEPCEDYTGSPDGAPAGCVPWFDLPRRSRDARVLFGHWAALGLMVREDAVGLDSGCVWGRELTAFCLEDGRVAQEPCADALRGR